MQKPLQLRTIASRPVRSVRLSPSLAARLQPQPRLQHLFAGRQNQPLAADPKGVIRGRTPTRTTGLHTPTKLGKRRQNSAWSPIRSAFSLSKFFLITATATTTAWLAHPHLLNLAAHVLHLDFKDSVTAFQTSFFSFLSLVFAIYSGNTMAFLYDRQKEMVKHLFHECMSLEELLEESVNTLGPDARDILAQVRLYIEEEIYAPENQAPPLGEGFALAAIRSKARNYRRAGTDVGEILQASQRLAHAQSERQATACRLLPPVHWALLYTIGALFVSTFILFETGGSFSNEGRHILFTVLCGLMSFVLCALRDLADPAEGVYNATALLDERLKYIIGMLDKYQKVPGGPARVSNYLSAGVPINKQEAEADQSDATSSSGQSADESEQTIREQLNSLASNAAQFVFPDAAPAQSSGAGEVGMRGSAGTAEAEAGKDGKLLLGGQPSSIAAELTDFRRQTQNSNNAVSFEGVRRRIAMFITTDDL
ncbi:hypothetical protein ABBQ38_002723 [Trebouxia sp. C0009 RCD-2024]